MIIKIGVVLAVLCGLLIAVDAIRYRLDPVYAKESNLRREERRKEVEAEAATRRKEAEAAEAKDRKSRIESSAHHIAREFVKQRLKAPSTAQFCRRDEAMVRVTKTGSYLVTGWVDAQNSFGAKLRNNYTVEMSYMVDTWRLIDIKIE